MTHHLFLAWSWFGHGQLTEMGLAFAISQFMNLRKLFVLKRCVLRLTRPTSRAPYAL